MNVEGLEGCFSFLEALELIVNSWWLGVNSWRLAANSYRPGGLLLSLGSLWFTGADPGWDPTPKGGGGGGLYGPQNCYTEQCALSAPEAPEILF